jgi:xanthine dehydrogenase accessory factor
LARAGGRRKLDGTLNELAQIVAAAREALSSAAPAVLATIVSVDGPSFRRPGTHALISGGEVRAGALSGGCLERDVCEHAARVIRDGRALLLRYDMARDGDLLWGTGSGCGGAVMIVVEPLDSAPAAGAIAFLEECLGSGREGVIATVVEGEGTVTVERMFVTESHVAGGPADASLRSWLELEARRVLGGTAPHASSAGSRRIVLEPVVPPLRLLLFGASETAASLASLARFLGWDAVLVDGGDEAARAEKYAGCRLIRHPALPVEVATAIGRRSAALLLSHRLAYDVEVVRQLLATKVPYIGVLGSRSRAAKLREELGGEGSLGRLHSPVGLAIGSDTPAEIALAIAAEVQAFFHGAEGRPLRELDGAIHAAGEGATEIS